MCSISQSLNLKIMRKSNINILKSWIYERPNLQNVPHSNGKTMSSRERYKLRQSQEQELIDNYLNSKR